MCSNHLALNLEMSFGDCSDIRLKGLKTTQKSSSEENAPIIAEENKENNIRRRYSMRGRGRGRRGRGFGFIGRREGVLTTGIDIVIDDPFKRTYFRCFQGRRTS